MLIYEVNLTIRNEIFTDYYKWLMDHIETMLAIKGFCYAEISEQHHEINAKKYTVRYALTSQKDLDNYFENHATYMRAEGLKKFGSLFSATRRVINKEDLQCL